MIHKHSRSSPIAPQTVQQAAGVKPMPTTIGQSPSASSSATPTNLRLQPRSVMREIVEYGPSSSTRKRLCYTGEDIFGNSPDKDQSKEALRHQHHGTRALHEQVQEANYNMGTQRQQMQTQAERMLQQQVAEFQQGLENHIRMTQTHQRQGKKYAGMQRHEDEQELMEERNALARAKVEGTRHTPTRSASASLSSAIGARRSQC